MWLAKGVAFAFFGYDMQKDRAYICVTNGGQ